MATRASAKILKCAPLLEHKTKLCVPFNNNFRHFATKSILDSSKTGAYVLASQLRRQSSLSSSYVSGKQLLHISRTWSVRHSRKATTSADAEQDEAVCTVGVEGDFDRLGLSPEVQTRLKERGINFLFPVQYKAYKQSMDGNDVIIQARTGTGKTLSFAIPLTEKLLKGEKNKDPKVLVLTPTRELANQISGDFKGLSNKVKVCCIVGGKSYTRQESELRNGVDVLVGTPGRVHDLQQKGVLKLEKVEHVVLDEVDAMLDMGFKDQVEEIISICYRKVPKPQTMLYSATMPEWVFSTAKSYLDKNYQHLNMVDTQGEQTALNVDQYAVACDPSDYVNLIQSYLPLFAGENGRTIIFCETKREVMKLTAKLDRIAKDIHGDKTQRERDNTLYQFKHNMFRVLICTNVAARGLDIPDVQLVIQTSPPNDPSSYIHRVGRTGRAGKKGTGIIFYDRSNPSAIFELEKLAKIKFKTINQTSNELTEIKLKQTIKRIASMPEYLVDKYKEIAEMMIESGDASKLLTASLIAAADIDIMVNKSALTGKRGYRTVWCKTDNKDLINNILIERDITTSLKEVRNEKALVFDIKDSEMSAFDEFKQVLGGSSVKLLEERPLLKGDEHLYDDTTYDRQSSFSNRNKSSFNRNQSYSNRNQSYSDRNRNYGSNNDNRYGNRRYNRSEDSDYDFAFSGNNRNDGYRRNTNYESKKMPWGGDHSHYD